MNGPRFYLTSYWQTGTQLHTWRVIDDTIEGYDVLSSMSAAGMSVEPLRDALLLAGWTQATPQECERVVEAMRAAHAAIRNAIASGPN